MLGNPGGKTVNLAAGLYPCQGGTNQWNKRNDRNEINLKPGQLKQLPRFHLFNTYGSPPITIYCVSSFVVFCYFLYE